MKAANKLKKKLSIAMVCDPIDYTAGSIVSTLRFSERLTENGHKVIFIAAKSPHASGDVNGIKTYRFRSILMPMTEGKFYLALPTVAEAKKVLRDEKIDILHLILPIGASFSFIKAAKSLGIKIVIHSHTQSENVFLLIPKIFGRRALSKVFDTYLARVYNNANILICPTEFAKENSPRVRENIKYEVISNGIDTARFTPRDPADFFQKYNLPPTGKKILFLGRLHPEKNIDTLIKAVPELSKKHPDVQVLIAGEGNQKDKLQKIARDLGVDDKIIFLGRISEEDLVFAYNSCDIFVLPSLAELEGIAVLEAMACGKPILIADSPNSASKHFVNRNGLLFKPQDPKDLAKKILMLLSDENALMSMARQSLEESKRYDINHSVALLELLYYSVLYE
jgi:glycosyltransferase involved in cell wall biosynthesis